MPDLNIDLIPNLNLINISKKKAIKIFIKLTKNSFQRIQQAIFHDVYTSGTHISFKNNSLLINIAQKIIVQATGVRVKDNINFTLLNSLCSAIR